MEQYNVTGMSCAACSARVEKAVSAVTGVTACSVSLLTNSMGVEGAADPAAVIKAVQDAGYGASEKGAKAQATADETDSLTDHETPLLKKRLIASAVFAVLMMYITMGHMIGLPLPSLSSGLSAFRQCYNNTVSGEIQVSTDSSSYTIYCGIGVHKTTIYCGFSLPPYR